MIKVKVTGMTCAHCAAAVTAAVRELPAVKDVAVDLERGEVTINGDPDLAAVRAVIREEGYDVAA